ncbi:MAG: inorganic phosphate transporter [Rhabdochlamydiaceae bacterium]
MDISLILTILVLVIGFYMAWNIGANDVSNAMGTSVGSGALTMKKAVFLAAILEFCGAYFVGGSVSETMQKGLIHTSLFHNDPQTLVIGMCSALLGTGLWLQVASFFGWPVSTTHAIVGSIVGFGLLSMGIDSIQWSELNHIIASWVLSPVMSGVISYFIFYFVQRKILYALNPTAAAIRTLPFLVFTVFNVFCLSFMYKGLDHLNLNLSTTQILFFSILIGSIAALITFFMVRFLAKKHLSNEIAFRASPQSVICAEKALKHLQRLVVCSKDDIHERAEKLLQDVKSLSFEIKKDSCVMSKTSHYAKVEKMFIFLQILSACYVAFAHGANDVANAVGPVAAVLQTIKEGQISSTASVPSWLLALGGLGIVLGLATWGWRVIETIGKKITELTPTRGFCAEFGAATTILLASKLGFPISTTHCLVGSVLGVGAARGIKAINLRMIKDIILSWIVTIPASALMTACIFYLMQKVF